ncbi:hypothetical protein [Cytobacillus gottheilii]|nr:hypothetical protein [Cytobacillus gottheilii]
MFVCDIDHIDIDQNAFLKGISMLAKRMNGCSVFIDGESKVSKKHYLY